MPVPRSRNIIGTDVPYGPVVVIKGAHKGRILYYDDDSEKNEPICYIGHFTEFLEKYYILPVGSVRSPTIDDLVKRHKEIWKELLDSRIDGQKLSPRREIGLMAERSYIDGELNSRRERAVQSGKVTTADVFLSHCSADKWLVRKVHDDLHNLGVKAWLDEIKIRVGDSIVDRISDGIRSSRYMVLFISDASNRSLWTKKEWQAFLARQLSVDSKTKLLPARIEKCEIPAILHDVRYADFVDDYNAGFDSLVDALS